MLLMLTKLKINFIKNTCTQYKVRQLIFNINILPYLNSWCVSNKFNKINY